MPNQQNSKKTGTPSEVSALAEECLPPNRLIDLELSATPDELHRLTRTLRAMNDCNQALIHSNDEMELLQKICNVVVEIGGYRMAWVGYAELDKVKRIRPIAQSGFEDGYLETAKISWDDTEFGRGPTGTAIRTGKPITSRDILNDPVMKPWRQDAIKRGYASSQSLPLKEDDEVFGALTIYSSRPDAFNAEETKLHTTLADNLAYGITILRTRQARKLAEEELRQSESRYRSLFQNKHNVMLIINQDNGKIVDANPAATTFYGWTHDELCRMNINEINLMTDHEIRSEMRLAHHEKRNYFLFQHRIANGSIRDVEVFSGPITFQHQSLLYSIINDITDRKKIQEELSAKNDRLHHIMAATKAGIWDYDIQTNTNTWSEEVWHLYGLKPNKGESTYETWINTIVPQDRERVEMAVQEADKTGGEYSCRWRILDPDGKERWLLSKGSPVKNSKGTIVRYAGLVIDITEQKKKEDALTESENRFKTLFEKHSSVMLIIDPETGSILDANQAAADFYGWPIDTLKQKQLQQLTISAPEEVSSQMEKFKAAEQYHQSYRHHLANGSIRDIDVFSCPITFNGKTLLYSIINDITERKLAEQALLSSERKFRSITEQLSEMVFVTDARGVLTYISPASEHLFGYLPQEMIGHLFTEYAEEHDIPRAMGLFTDTLLHNLSTRVIEFKCLKKNGSLFDGEIHFQFYNDHASAGTIGLIHDITERKRQEILRKQHEHEVRESQQFLASIYDAVNHSIFVVDVGDDGGFRYKGINPMHEKLTGFNNGDIRGKTPEEVLDSEVAKAVTHNYEACIREGRTIQYEEALLLQGKMSWWETALNPVRNDTGHIYRIIGTSKNITERKQVYAQLKKMSAAVEQSPAVVVITDPLGNIEYVNPMFTEHTGYSAEEARGQNPRILKSGLVPKALYKDLWQTILSGKVWRGELHNKKKNGELYWESVVIAAILNAEGVITNFVAVKEDITEQKKMLDELIAAKEKAEESDHLKSAFLANISHEIRTPMNGILGFSELLKEPHLSGEEMAEYIDLIQKSGQRMLNLINDLIDISRIDALETKLQISATPLNDLMRDLHAFFKPEAESKRLRLTCTTGLTDRDSLIKTDSVKLNQILTNLIKNALKFTRSGGIDFGYFRKDGVLEFYVIDTGIGVPKDMREKVFDRFRQVDNTLTRGYEGAGLGLSITKAYVEMLGGKIGVESLEDGGSKFFFTMEYMPAVSAIIPQSTPVEQLPSLPVPTVTILIAEDDEVSTLLLKKSLKGENIHIHFAENGQEAVELVKHHPEIKLVVMDIKMPEMNGYDATKQIKLIRPALPVIAQTAFTSKEDKERAKEAGFDRFITKPIKKSELLEMMNELLHW